jgi:HD-like signal output (HDOD) protein
VAVGAAHLAGAGDRVSRERAFTAGLVHDIGKLVLNGPLKARLQQLPQTGSYDALRQGERELLGFDHTEAGQALAEAWNFPSSLAVVIGRHHDLQVDAEPGDQQNGDRNPTDQCEADPDTTGLVRFVAAANLAASRAGHGAGSACDDDTWQAALAALGIDPAEAEAMVARIPVDVGALAGATEGRP